MLRILHNYHAMRHELGDNNTARQLPCKTLPCKGMTTGKIFLLASWCLPWKVAIGQEPNLQHGCPFCIFLVQHIIDRIAHKCSQGALGLVPFRLSTLYMPNLVSLTVSWSDLNARRGLSQNLFWESDACQQGARFIYLAFSPQICPQYTC